MDHVMMQEGAILGMRIVCIAQSPLEFDELPIGGRAVQPTFEDGLKNQVVLEAVEKSAQNRKWVKVK